MHVLVLTGSARRDSYTRRLGAGARRRAAGRRARPRPDRPPVLRPGPRGRAAGRGRRRCARRCATPTPSSSSRPSTTARCPACSATPSTGCPARTAPAACAASPPSRSPRSPGEVGGAAPSSRCARCRQHRRHVLGGAGAPSPAAGRSPLGGSPRARRSGRRDRRAVGTPSRARVERGRVTTTSRPPRRALSGAHPRGAAPGRGTSAPPADERAALASAAQLVLLQQPAADDRLLDLATCPRR